MKLIISPTEIAAFRKSRRRRNLTTLAVLVTFVVFMFVLGITHILQEL